MVDRVCGKGGVLNSNSGNCNIQKKGGKMKIGDKAEVIFVGTVTEMKLSKGGNTILYTVEKGVSPYTVAICVEEYMLNDAPEDCEEFIRKMEAGDAKKTE